MSVSSMRSDSSSSRRKGSVETRGEFEIYISDVVVHPRYTGYLIKVRSRHGLNRNVVKRYSSLRKLHHTLKERFPTRQIPPFPPKCWFSNTSTEFLKQRRFDLEHYLQQLATNVGIMRLHEVIEFWETNDADSEQHQVVIFGEIPEEEDDDEEDEKSTKISASRDDKVI